MQFDIITLFPEMFDALGHGITARAQEKGQLTLKTWQLRDFATRGDGRVDDRPYGGGPGMVLEYQPIHDAITTIKATHKNTPKVIYLSPQGKPFTQESAKAFAQSESPLIILTGRYEGIDERLFAEDIDEEWSVGDFVVSGGELPAMLFIDAITRLLPGTLGDPDSAAQDSFEDSLLDCPHYTRPADIHGLLVPSVLQSGDHNAIARWRLKQSLGKTWQKRPDLLKRRTLSDKEKHLLQLYIQEEKNNEHTHSSD